MSITFTQIAREAGVSLSLVSRLLNRDASLQVSDATRRRVLDVYHKLGGRINTRASVRKKCYVNVPINAKYAARIETLVSSSWWINAQQVLEQNDGKLTPVFIDHEERFETIEAWVKRDESCDALMFLSGIMDSRIADLLNDQQFPHVSTSIQDTSYHVNTICGDAYHGIHRVAKHLLNAGHVHIGYMGNSTEHLPMLAGEMMAAGLALKQKNFCNPGYMGNMSDQEVRNVSCRCALKFLKKKSSSLLTAIVCRNDMTAFGLMDAMKITGLIPGKDLAVVGYDDIESRGFLYAQSPVLTTVRNPYEEIGRHVAELILEQVQGGRSRIVHEYVPSPLIVRESSPHNWQA